jgi:nicotinamidase-related amidase
MTQFPIVPRKTGLLFFDSLRGYLEPADPAVRAEVERLGVVPAMVKLNRGVRAAGIPVFYAQPDHRPDHRDFVPIVVDKGYAAGGASPSLLTPPHLVAGDAGAEVLPAISPLPGDYIIKKHRWSAFYQTHLELSLRAAGIDTILLAGLATDVGVASTAYAARDMDFSLVIVRDACLSHRREAQATFMEQVFPIFTRVMRVDEVLAAIAP